MGGSGRYIRNGEEECWPVTRLGCGPLFPTSLPHCSCLSEVPTGILLQLGNPEAEFRLQSSSCCVTCIKQNFLMKTHFLCPWTLKSAVLRSDYVSFRVLRTEWRLHSAQVTKHIKSATLFSWPYSQCTEHMQEWNFLLGYMFQEGTSSTCRRGRAEACLVSSLPRVLLCSIWSR